MGTPYSEVYESFLMRINDNSFIQEQADYLIEEELLAIMKMAIENFKFPSTNLYNRDDSAQSFLDTLLPQEIQVLGLYMKYEWASRCVANFRLVYPQYQARDFQQAGSPANHLDKLRVYAKEVWKEAESASSRFHRAREHKVYDYGNWAGSNE